MGFISMLTSWCVLRWRKLHCKWRILLLVTCSVCSILFILAQIFICTLTTGTSIKRNPCMRNKESQTDINGDVHVEFCDGHPNSSYLYIDNSQNGSKPLRPPCLWSYLALKQYQQLSPLDNNNVLVVTGYLNLGNFQGVEKTFSFYKYLVWAEAFQYTLNPLVVYTDSDQIENLFHETRKHLLNRTKVIRVHRSQLHAFQDVERLRDLFHSPTYPKHWPNTVIPEYPCSQHAKYEFVQNAIENNYFPWTKYVAWIDIGYFRYITSRHRNFWIVAPPGMDDSKVAVTRVHNQNMDNSPVDIHLENLVWVGGGMSLATRTVFRKFIEEYQHATDTFLGEGLSNTDQQVIYSMFTKNYQSSHEIKSRLQTYRWIDWMFNDVMDCWFYLGYLCYREQRQ